MAKALNTKNQILYEIQSNSKNRSGAKTFFKEILGTTTEYQPKCVNYIAIDSVQECPRCKFIRQKKRIVDFVDL